MHGYFHKCMILEWTVYVDNCLENLFGDKIFEK